MSGFSDKCVELCSLLEKAESADQASRQLPEEKHTRAERRDEVMSDPPAFDPETSSTSLARPLAVDTNMSCTNIR